jgi:hypothetical protein
VLFSAWSPVWYCNLLTEHRDFENWCRNRRELTVKPYCFKTSQKSHTALKHLRMTPRKFGTFEEANNPIQIPGTDAYVTLRFPKHDKVYYIRKKSRWMRSNLCSVCHSIAAATMTKQFSLMPENVMRRPTLPILVHVLLQAMAWRDERECLSLLNSAPHSWRRSLRLP